MHTPRIPTSSAARSFRAGLLALAGAGFLIGCEPSTGNPPTGSISIPRKGGTTTTSAEKAEKGAEKPAEKPAAK